MPCVCALSTGVDSQAALADVVDRVAQGFASDAPDVAVVFASRHHADVLGQAAAALRARVRARHVIGCTGETIIGEDREIEETPALTVWAATLPGAVVDPVRVCFDNEFDGWPGAGGDAQGSALILLADPFTFPADRFLSTLNETERGLRVVGGMASAGNAPGGNRLVLDEREFRDGAVGLRLSGQFALRTVVSQGCRPIGRPYIVTKVDGHMVRELGRRPALEVVRELFEALAPGDQALVQKGLHLGRVISEYQESFGRGDFLVGNVLGADAQGGIAITASVRVGQTVQFHVRDAETADEDLRTLLAQERSERPGARRLGALLFSCNGRGTRLFETPNHDAAVLREILGPIPVAGFFAMGELGPVGGQNFVHGYTASIALFEDA